MSNIIQKKYLPFSKDALKQHFITSNFDALVNYYERSAGHYHNFMLEHESARGVPITASKKFCQIEKDERFWVLTTLKKIFDAPDRKKIFTELLSLAFGERPPLDNFNSWNACLAGDLHLFFETSLPAPASYKSWLISHQEERHLIPYVLEAKKNSSGILQSNTNLEGPTHVDALLLNASNGFAVVIEAKVLSDISYGITFDVMRNQLIRNVDVMLESNQNNNNEFLKRRLPDNTLFALLTPRMFRENKHSRLYGWLYEEYKSDANALKRDLVHRTEIGTQGFNQLREKIGWFTFEDCNELCPGSCPWLN